MKSKSILSLPVCDLRNIYEMEDIDYKNKDIPEEVAPYAKEIFTLLRKEEVKICRVFSS